MEEQFEDKWQWFISFSGLTEHIEFQPIYFLTQFIFIFGGIVTFIHAYINGRKWRCFWLASMLNGLMLELISYNVPSIDNFWHSQTPVMFFGKRLPLHILFLYPCLYYVSIVLASLSHIASWKKPFLVGLIAIIIDAPYDIVGIKFLEWTWHDTDPNIYDRSYWVPWTSYYFHLTFSLFIAMFSAPGNWRGVFMSLFLSCSMCFISFSILYHPLHDLADIHTEVIVSVLISIYICIIFPNSNEHLSESVGTKYNYLLKLYLFLHYAFFLLATLFGKPEDQKSVGFHQPVGLCNVTESVYTLSMKVLKRRKYLCLSDYDEGYFDFHCTNNAYTKEKEPISWYTICGTPFENRAEYIAVILCITLVSYFIFFSFIFRSSSLSTKKCKVK